MSHRIKLVSEPQQILCLPAVNCAPGGGRMERLFVPVYHVQADLPPSDLDGLLVTGDLQFYDRSDVPEEDRVLMSHVLAQELSALSDCGMVPPRDRIGVILTGDHYAVPSLLERGGAGDVQPIWEEFADNFRWVAGVAGNHDLFGGQDEFPGCLKLRADVFPLNGFEDLVEVDGMRIGGISGILGNPRKIWQHDSDFLIEHARLLLSEGLDLFVLHQGPKGSQAGMKGSGVLNEILDEADLQPGLTLCGHCHWPKPIDRGDKRTVVNVDGCAILFTRPGVPMELTYD